MFLKLSAWLVAWHFFACLNAQPLSPQPVTITAQLIHADSITPQAMVFNFLNPFIPVRKSGAFDEHGQLGISSEMVFTQNMTIQYNGSFINLLVAPGDSVHLVIDGSRLKEKNFNWLSVSGDKALASQQLNQWHHYFATRFNKKFQPAKSLTDMVDSVRLEYRHCLAVLDSYALVNRLLPEVKKWAQNDIKYTVSYWAADYLTENDSLTGQLRLNEGLYADPLFDQYNPAGFQSMMFPYHIGNYAHTLLKRDSNIHLLRQNMQYKKAAERAFKLFAREPSGLSRDYMLFNYINGLLPRAPRLLDSLPGLAAMFSDTLAYTYLVQAVDRMNHPPLQEKPIAGMIQLNKTGTQTTPPVEILQYFSKKYPGKVLYIDVYATWCIPCLQESEKMPAIEARVDSSGVAFINICLQSDEDAWHKLIKKRDYHGENYFLGEDATKLFMGMYGIEGFPTYILIDKKGVIRSMKAPRPSDGDLLIRTLGTLTQ